MEVLTEKSENALKHTPKLFHLSLLHSQRLQCLCKCIFQAAQQSTTSSNFVMETIPPPRWQFCAKINWSLVIGGYFMFQTTTSDTFQMDRRARREGERKLIWLSKRESEWMTFSFLYSFAPLPLSSSSVVVKAISRDIKKKGIRNGDEEFSSAREKKTSHFLVFSFLK